MRAVHFGAGNIGRGFIGLVLSQSGFEVCFVDINDTLVKRLNEQNEYTVTLASEAKDAFVVRDVTAIHSDNEAQVAQTIAQADLITTAIGADNLKYIAKGIANGITLRHKHSAGPMHVIACENGIGGSNRLKQFVYEHLPAEARAYAESTIAFPNAMVDRIVPNQRDGQPCGVLVEPFYEWVVERPPLNQDSGNIKGVLYVDELQPYLERKLFTVNTGHCAAAYLGYLKDYATIQEAMHDPHLKNDVLEILGETGEVLINKFGFDRQEHQAYIQTTIERFGNQRLSDEITRIGRSPVRKLSPHERLVYPVLQAHALEIKPKYLTLAIAAALCFDCENDGEAVKIQSVIKSEGIRRAITHFTGIPVGHPLHKLILDHYTLLRPHP